MWLFRINSLMPNFTIDATACVIFFDSIKLTCSCLLWLVLLISARLSVFLFTHTMPTLATLYRANLGNVSVRLA